MTKISSLTALTGAGVDAAADLLPIVDMSLAGTSRNKKILVSELKISFNLGTAADLDIDTDDTLAADSDSLIPTQQAVKAYVDAAAGAISELDDIPDVNAPAPANGDVLTWDSTPGEWIAAAPTGGSNDLDDLTDVNAPTPANGDVLTWDSTPGEWVSAAPTGGSNALDDLTDVDAPTPSDGDVLTFDSGSGDWVPAAPTGGGGAVELISEQSPSGTGTVTFSSIPGTYRDLILVVRGRGTTAATSVAALMTFNNDTGSNYDKERLTVNNHTSVGGAGNAGSTSIDMGGIAAASATADVADVIQAEIFDYRGTTFQKAAFTRNTLKTGTANTNFTQQIQSAWWRNTAAITEIDIVLNAGNFVAGSVVSLYGRM